MFFGGIIVSKLTLEFRFSMPGLISHRENRGLISLSPLDSAIWKRVGKKPAKQSPIHKMFILKMDQGGERF
ncbi:MAG: hypothetical protein CMI17_00375 [Opitutaceae bacterium]|nr:hypothetical protein [Opitutaceae bacterium]